MPAALPAAGKGGERGVARPEVLSSLLGSCERVVQQIDSVEYGLTDIQVRVDFVRLQFGKMWTLLCLRRLMLFAATQGTRCYSATIQARVHVCYADCIGRPNSIRPSH